MPDERAVWLYCVARRERPAARAPRPAWIREHGVERVEHGGPRRAGQPRAAVRVRRGAAAPQPERPAWLERVARGHEAVLERALEHATIVPVRLCTIFADEQGAARMLDEQRAELGGGARRARRPQRVVGEAARRPGRAGGCGAAREDARRAGGARQRGRRTCCGAARSGGLRELAQRLAAELAEDVHSRLRECASDAVVNAPQNRELSGHEGEMLLNGAYLVEAAERRAAARGGRRAAGPPSRAGRAARAERAVPAVQLRPAAAGRAGMTRTTIARAGGRARRPRRPAARRRRRDRGRHHAVGGGRRPRLRRAARARDVRGDRGGEAAAAADGRRARTRPAVIELLAITDDAAPPEAAAARRPAAAG